MTGINGDRALDLLKRLGGERLGGSAAEAKAAGVLAQELRSFGLEPVIEEFEVWTYDEGEAGLEVRAPYARSVAAVPIGLSGQTPEGGVVGELVYVHNAEPMYLHNLQGRIALYSGRMWGVQYEALARAGVAGIVCIADPGKKPLSNNLEPEWFEKLGKIPGAWISFEEGLRLIKSGATQVRLVVQQEERRSLSHNVIAEVEGLNEHEAIVVGGHFDSHLRLYGAHDNGAGSVIMMELARALAGTTPRRTVRFAWFGSEELGDRGSRAYIERHKDELGKVLFELNLDVGGNIIGYNGVSVMGPPELKAFVEWMDKERGWGMGQGRHIEERVYGGDNVFFLREGIPSVCFYRMGGSAYYLHTPDDSLDFVDGAHLAVTAEIALDFLQRIANAYEFPIKREVPANIKEQLQTMLRQYWGLKE